MSVVEYFDDEESEIGLTRDEIRLVARRQFVASLAAAFVIAVGAVLMALIPASRDHAQLATNKFAIVQQPTFLAQPDQGVASAKQSEIELT